MGKNFILKYKVGLSRNLSGLFCGRTSNFVCLWINQRSSQSRRILPKCCNANGWRCPRLRDKPHPASSTCEHRGRVRGRAQQRIDGNAKPAIRSEDGWFLFLERRLVKLALLGAICLPQAWTLRYYIQKGIQRVVWWGIWVWRRAIERTLRGGYKRINEPGCNSLFHGSIRTWISWRRWSG